MGQGGEGSLGGYGDSSWTSPIAPNMDKTNCTNMELLSVVAEQVVVGAGNQQHVS